PESPINFRTTKRIKSTYANVPPPVLKGPSTLITAVSAAIQSTYNKYYLRKSYLLRGYSLDPKKLGRGYTPHRRVLITLKLSRLLKRLKLYLIRLPPKRALDLLITTYLGYELYLVAPKYKGGILVYLTKRELNSLYRYKDRKLPPYYTVLLYLVFKVEYNPTIPKVIEYITNLKLGPNYLARGDFNREAFKNLKLAEVAILPKVRRKDKSLYKGVLPKRSTIDLVTAFTYNVEATFISGKITSKALSIPYLGSVYSLPYRKEGLIFALKKLEIIYITRKYIDNTPRIRVNDNLTITPITTAEKAR
ncbi:hypothetical protein N7457_003225, partial [Penicillium paradoxum]|uniref:uncharacterized protein n=1 Tax=Penicillium paradoxum TaxID=176176 RepID=UPI002546A6EF